MTVKSATATPPGPLNNNVIWKLDSAVAMHMSLDVAAIVVKKDSGISSPVRAVSPAGATLSEQRVTAVIFAQVNVSVNQALEVASATSVCLITGNSGHMDVTVSSPTRNINKHSF